MKKVFAILFILVLAGGALFFAGWVQFSVPAGKYGVLISKTGGVDPTPVTPSRFRWQWERLIPTNAQIVVFDLAPLSRTVSVSGTLPSGDIYRSMLEGSPDFSWKFDIALTVRVKPTTLPSLVSKFDVRDQEAIKKLTDARLTEAATATGNALVADFARNPAKIIGSDATASALSERVSESFASSAASDLELLSATVSNVHFPDFALYDLAAKTYAAYEERRTTLMTEAAEVQARSSVADYLEMERFSRLGEVLTKYPILIDYLAVTRDDSGEAFKTIKSRR